MSKEKETGNRRPSLSGFRVCAGSGMLFATATIKAKPQTVLLPAQMLQALFLRPASAVSCLEPQDVNATLLMF